MSSCRILQCSMKHMYNCLHRRPCVLLPLRLENRQFHISNSFSASVGVSNADSGDTATVTGLPPTGNNANHKPPANTGATYTHTNHTTNTPATTEHQDDQDDDLGPGPGPGSLSLPSFSPSSSSAAAAAPPLPPALYVIPTPIGNLRDISLRAVDTLGGVTLLLAEDTRHTRKLLNHLGIRNLELLSCHEHNEKLRLARVLQRLQQGEPVGLVSDAGMPGISDPGHLLVAAAVAAGVRVVALPGPCAGLTALVGSGLPTHAFTFVGFLPPKSGARRRALQRLAPLPSTLVLQAPPHGLAGVLADCVEELGGGRACCVAREISKLHEEYFRSTLAGALREFSEVRQARGEICLIIQGCSGEEPGAAGWEEAAGGSGDEGDNPGGGGGGGSSSGGGVGVGAMERVLRELLEGGMTVSAAVKEVATNLGVKKKAAYAAALRISESLGRRQQGAEGGGDKDEDVKLSPRGEGGGTE
ncbi:hypothetical protein Agub_g9206 [Astrephomene gubernaculifera]|uniref:Tetrapyrrole methylase domain-containing protein n=1 Tax=Astrephomene gubernaculifera TaxID=47775 RepID=A0AAD3DUS6_9CHLO|nr:hypothetical protein Agub_g9206 [Astrephomene gubernaculifera]